MSRATPPNKRSSLVAGFVLNTLDDIEASEFSRLAASDPTLLEDVEQLQQSLEESYGIEEASPPPMLRDRLLASYSTQVALGHLSKPASQDRNSPALRDRGKNTALKAALAALAIALTLSNLFWWQSSRQQIAKQLPEENSQASTQSYELEVTEVGQSGTVEVTIDPDTLTATLAASNLPPITSDQTYVLWTVLVPDAPYTTDSKSAVLAATFTVDSQGETTKNLALPNAFEQPDSVAALAVTVESTAAPQAHEGSPLLLARLQEPE